MYNYYLKRILSYIKVHFTQLLFLIVSIVFIFTLASFIAIGTYSKDIYTVNQLKNDNIPVSDVAIVFGAGIIGGQPQPLLAQRLDTANELLRLGYVKKIILSGDNRSIDYNEPAAMMQYLISVHGTPADSLQPDYAGRSTYETCQRAKEIFDINDAVLISESTHLPRAIYLCEHFGIDVVGIRSNKSVATTRLLGQYWREIFARNKAIFNIYILGERTILGEKIPLN